MKTSPDTRTRRVLPALALGAYLLAGTLPGASPSSPDPAMADEPAAHNLVAIEFRESPVSDLSLVGGYLGVPDSTGAFPANYRRYDPVTGVEASAGVPYGGVLVFRDLRPGSYRMALFLLERTGAMKRLLPKETSKLGEDHCLVYGDSLPKLTFTVGRGELRYLGRVTRKTRPSTASEGLWETTVEWSAGDEEKAWKDLAKQKDLSAWKEPIRQRTAVLDSTEKAGHK